MQTQGETGTIIVESMADMAVSPPQLRTGDHLDDHKEACLLSTARKCVMVVPDLPFVRLS